MSGLSDGHDGGEHDDCMHADDGAHRSRCGRACAGGRPRLLRCRARIASARRRRRARARRPVYYTAQTTGKLGILDPKTGKYEEMPLGTRSAPHGVIVGPDGAPWITDGGQNAIVRVDPATRALRVFPLPARCGIRESQHADVRQPRAACGLPARAASTARLEPCDRRMKVWKAPRGSGPYGITTTPSGRGATTRRSRATTSRASTPRPARPR